MPIRLITFLLLIAVSLVPLRAEGQQDRGPLRLTLKDAVQLALKQNIDLQLQNLNAATAQQERVTTRAALLPQASLQATEQISRYNLEALIGLQFAGVTTNVGPYQAFHAGVRFSSPVFDLTLLQRYEASGHREQASRDDVASTREQTVLLSVSQYLACLRADAEVTAANSRVALATGLEKQAEALFADGVATKIDVSRAEVRLLNEKQRLIDAQRDTLTTRFTLKRILNESDSASVELLDKDLFSQTPSFDINDPVGAALAQRPELHSLANSVLTAQAEHRAAIAESLPTLTLNGIWNQQGRTFGSLYPGYDYEAMLNLPLFTSGRLRADRHLATIQEQRRVQQLQDARNRVSEQVRSDEEELRAARTDVELGRQQVKLAKEEVELSQGRFSAGVTDNIEVTTAQDELARANDLEIAAHFRYNVARANLARAVGSVEAIYSRP